MARSILSDAERLAWERFPQDPDPDVIGVYFTLADGEVDDLRRLPTPAGRLATAIAVAAIRWLGFVPAELQHAPSAGVQRLATQLDVDVDELAAYDPPERTAREHRQRAAQLAHFRDPDARDVDDVEDVLVEHALEHDSPLALLRTAAITLRDRQLLRPAISTLERLVASARARAERDTYERLEPVLDAQTRRALHALCVTDVRLGVSRLVWLGREAKSASPAQIVGQLEKLAFLRELGAPDWLLETVSANRRRQLAALARRSTTAALAGRPDQLRYPALLCFCHDQAVRLLDEILDRADQAVGEAHGQALRELRDLKAQTATAANEKVALFDLLVGLLLDEDVADDEVRARAWEAMAPERWAAAREQAQAILRPLDDNHYAQLDGRYSHLRRFVPALIAALRFDSVPAARPLVDAIAVLRKLDATGRRTLPDTAPTGFVPARWRTHVTGEDGRPDRRRWELCLLSELRTALRSGAVWVEGSRRYQPADRYLIAPAAWPARRDAARRMLGLPASVDERHELLARDLDERVTALDRALATGDVAVDVQDGELHVRRLPGAERPERTTALAAHIASRVPQVDLADILIDVDAWTEFSYELTHAHGATPRQPRLHEHRYAALLAHACNLGYARMGQAARIDPQQLAWTTQWYLRPEALAAANARIVNAHHALPLAQQWGDGRFSSSDGKRYPVGVDSPEARAVSRYFGRGRGVTFYVWTSDQHTHYATRVVRTTVRDATYVLDAILDNQTELPIEKHTTDTAGYSDIIFALFDLLGLQFAPRLAGLPDRRLYRLATSGTTPAAQLLAHPLNLDLIRDGWDDLVRCAASLRDGTVTASLLVARLQAAGGKLPLTRALQEYGRLVKTRFVLGYLADETERRAIGRQQNKSESLHALHDRTFHGNHGTVRLHTLQRQSTEAHCLHLVANAIVYWNTIYIQHALDEVGYAPVGDELAGLTPTIFEHVNPLGTYDFSSDRPAGQLRPLRTATAA
ncbi:MAG: hypothetical protein QOG94_2257 [Solirubrobacteraceae bacterium]|nr:hypothetical protein [Solirubrobacteraceae bacterium]